MRLWHRQRCGRTSQTIPLTESSQVRDHLVFGSIDMKGPEQVDLQTEVDRRGLELRWERRFITNGRFSRDKNVLKLIYGDGCRLGKVSLNCTHVKWVGFMICKIYLNKAFLKHCMYKGMLCTSQA